MPGRRGQDAQDRAPRKAGKLPDGSQPEPPPDFLQGDIVARFRPGQIQLGRGLGIDDFLLTQFRKKRNGHLHLSVRKGIHERLKAVAIGGHASTIVSRATGRSGPEHQAFHVETGSMVAIRRDHHMGYGLVRERRLAGGIAVNGPATSAERVIRQRRLCQASQITTFPLTLLAN